MNTYFEKLSAEQRKNIALIVERMKKKGITNPFTHAAILSVVSKESGFIPKSEISYKTTSNARINSIFSKTKTLSDQQLTTLKNNDVAFFNFIYGGKYGNAADEGYKYRGRGFNQLTFKGNYKSIGERIGANLVANPDLLNFPEVAADVLIDFFVREFNTAKKAGYLKDFNTVDINGFKNLNDSLKAVFQANRGWLKKGTDTTGGFDIAKARVEGFVKLIGNTISENKGTAGALGLGIIVITAAAFIFKDNLKQIIS